MRRPGLEKDRPRSRRRLPSFSAPTLSYRPGITLSASSIDFDQTKLASKDSRDERLFSAFTCNELYEELAMCLRWMMGPREGKVRNDCRSPGRGGRFKPSSV